MITKFFEKNNVLQDKRFATWLAILMSFLLLLLLPPIKTQALTVNFPKPISKDMMYRPALMLETGERDFEVDIDFNRDRTVDLSGTHRFMMLRNDVSFSDRVTIGLNFALGAVDYGSVSSGTDSLNLDGHVGVGGGLRVNAIVFEDLLGADWFADFQSFAMASDPANAMLQREDWHLALGAQGTVESLNVSGGAIMSASQFEANGSSQQGHPVDLSAHEGSRYGLFVTTSIPFTDRINGFTEVKAVDGIAVSIGANYQYELDEYVPPVARQKVEGSRPVTGDERGYSRKKYLARARVEITNQRYGEALDLLSAALDEEFKTAEAHYLIARVYRKTGKLPKALDYIRYAVELKPENVTYRYYFGLLLEENGQRDQAIQQYERLLELDPSHQKALYQLNNL
jgi:hypothetical protein